MIVKIDKTFVRDSSRIKDKNLLRRVALAINQVIQANSLEQIPSVKKLKGEADCYRIRLGDYRIGLKVLGEVVIFIRILHRKEIYKFFP